MIIVDETGIEIVLVIVIIIIVVIGASLVEIGTIAVVVTDIGFVIDKQEFLHQIK